MAEPKPRATESSSRVPPPSQDTDNSIAPEAATATIKCSTVLIPDEPAEADSFGPHGRLAAAVVDLIRNTDGGKAIGIEGGWGSGKTTVVKLVKSEIERDGNYTVVEFDAWAHEGDPL